VGNQALHDVYPAIAATDGAVGSGTQARVRALVRAAQDGDRESFGRIFDEFHLPVYRYIAARLESATDAEDAAAETFAAAFVNIRHFRWRGPPFEAWLFRIARSKVVDHQRRLQRRPTSRNAGEWTLPAQTGDPSRNVVWHEEQAQLLAAVRRLSMDQREVVALRFFADLSVPEVAQVMGRSPGAVRQLQFRAVTALRQRMGWLR
jgi:RNA polymerase sigma-70 factor (ECF subfamily)